MLYQICICCGGKLVGPSPCNPNICLTCEHLDEELERLTAELKYPIPAHRGETNAGHDAAPEGVDMAV